MKMSVLKLSVELLQLLINIATGKFQNADTNQKSTTYLKITDKSQQQDVET